MKDRNTDQYSNTEADRRFKAIVRAALTMPRTQMKDIERVPAKRGRKPKASAPKSS